MYIIAWYVGRATHDNVALQDAAERLEEKLRVEPCRLPEVLSQEPSDCTVASKSHGQELRWIEDYPIIFGKHGVPWPTRRHPVSDRHGLTDREDAVLHFFELKYLLGPTTGEVNEE